MRTNHAQGTLAGVVTRQDGVVTRAQLLDLGFSSDAIGQMLRAGVLRRLRPGVYAAGVPGAAAHVL